MARTNASKHKFEEILNSDTGIPKFKRIMAATEKPDIYLAYFKECLDRAYGRPDSSFDVTYHDDPSRPTTESLIETIRALREELGSLRERAKVEAGE